VVPRKIDSEGNFISHSLAHHHQHTPQHRERRDTQASQPVYFVIPVPQSEELVLEVWPSTNFLAPNLMVQKTLKQQIGTNNAPHSCHYQGHIKGEPDSRVTISACHGLVSTLLYFLF
jgi:hypothetical protein